MTVNLWVILSEISITRTGRIFCRMFTLREREKEIKNTKQKTKD